MSTDKKLRRLLKGTAARAQTARDYIVQQLAHKKVSAGEPPVRGLFDEDYEEYFEIKLIHKLTGEELVFVAGDIVKDLLRYAKQEPLQLFSLEKQFNNAGGGGNGGGGSDMTPLNQELYNAVNLYKIDYQIGELKHGMLEIVLHIAKNPDVDVPRDIIEKFERNISSAGWDKWRKKTKPLSAVVNAAAKRHPNCKNFSFKHLAEVVGPNKFLSM